MADNKQKNSKTTRGKKQARGLGRGLSALMDDVSFDDVSDSADDTPPADEAPDTSQTRRAESGADGKGVLYVTMDQLVRNPDQPRRHFDDRLLSELADSIRDKGVLQPILVRPLPDAARAKLDADYKKSGYERGFADIHKGSKPVYQVIAGERRWTASMRAGLERMPVFVREITDREALEIGVVENVHRADLNPMEEALAYKSLLTQFSRTQEDVAQAVGKSRPYIANMLRLLNLPERVQDYLSGGQISTGHARAIIAAPDPTQLAETIVDKQLSVRQAEDWVRRIKKDGSGGGGARPAAEKSADIRRVEAKLMDSLGLSVDLSHAGPGGQLKIKYKNGDQLEDLIARLTQR